MSQYLINLISFSLLSTIVLYYCLLMTNLILCGPINIITLMCPITPSPYSPHTKDGKTALMLASVRGHSEIVSKLIASTASVDITDKVSMTSMEGVQLII